MKNLKFSSFRKLFNPHQPGLPKNWVRWLFVICALPLSGCTGGQPAAPHPRVLNLAIWGNYFDPAEEKKFEEASGIDVQITNYSSNEELLAKLQAGAGGIDLAVPSDYMVGILAKQGLLQPLDKAKISHWGEIDPQYLKLEFDPENTYSAPYAWTVTGIAVQRELFQGKITGWKALLENPDLKGKISLLDDTREVFTVALKALGYSANDKDEAHIKAAQEWLINHRSQVKMFRSDVTDLLLRKEVAAAQAYGGEALMAWKKSDGKVELILPEEGGTTSLDNLVIPKGAQHLSEAHALIDYFLTAEVNKRFVERIFAGPVLKSTRAHLSADLKNNSQLFPPLDLLKKFERIQDLGETTRLYDRAWTEIKSQ